MLIRETIFLQCNLRQIAYYWEYLHLDKRYLGARLSPSVSSRNTLRDDWQLYWRSVDIQLQRPKYPLTRKSIQLRAKAISFIGYSWLVSWQYSRSRSSSGIGTSLSAPLNPLICLKFENIGLYGICLILIAHGWVRLAKSASYLNKRNLRK